MKKLLAKEFRLAMHPTTPLFWLLSAMLLIPYYPYYVAFFYTGLGLFFVCLTGRENHDIEYSMGLPVRKRDLVRGRIGYAVAVEAVQVLVDIPFAILRQGMPLPGNSVGMDANIAFFGLAILMLGIFNWVFFRKYYGAPDKVGPAFLWASVAVFGYMLIAEAAAHVVLLVRDQMDTPDPQFIGVKLVTLAVGIALYALLTWDAYRVSVKRFEALDL